MLGCLLDHHDNVLDLWEIGFIDIVISRQRANSLYAAFSKLVCVPGKRPKSHNNDATSTVLVYCRQADHSLLIGLFNIPSLWVGWL